MNTQPNSSDDPLETLLRKAPASVPDEGFSARVLAALPPPTPKPRRLPARRTIAYLLGALTGLLWAIAHPGASTTGDFTALNSSLATLATVFNSLSNPTVLVVASLILGSLVFAYFREIVAKLERIF